MTFLLPHLGELDLDSLSEYYSTKLDFNETIIRLDLNFENKTTTLAILKSIKKIINEIPRLDKQNNIYIEDYFNDDDDDTVRFYLEHHLEEINKQELSALIDFSNENIEPQKQLLAKLHLVRVGMYPDSDESFAVFDYSLGESLTNYLVVVKLDKKGKLDYMTMES